MLIEPIYYWITGQWQVSATKNLTQQLRQMSFIGTCKVSIQQFSWSQHLYWATAAIIKVNEYLSPTFSENYCTILLHFLTSSYPVFKLFLKNFWSLESTRHHSWPAARSVSFSSQLCCVPALETLSRTRCRSPRFESRSRRSSTTISTSRRITWAFTASYFFISQELNHQCCNQLKDFEWSNSFFAQSIHIKFALLQAA